MKSRADYMKTMMAAFALSVVSISSPFVSNEVRGERALASEDDQTDKVLVEYVSTANDPLEIRAIDGTGLGYSKGPVRLKMYIDVATAKASIDPTTGQVDGPTLLRNISPKTGTDGKNYYEMRVLQPLEMSDGRTVMPETETAESKILLRVDDLQLNKVVFPVAARADASAPAPVQSVARNLDQHFAQNGLTDASLPPQTDEEDTSSDTQLAADNSDEDEDENDTPVFGTSIKKGNPFPQRFLSAPVCSCVGGMCGVSSGFGWCAKWVKGKKGRKGHWSTPRAGNGYASKNHKGLDINTSGHHDGSGVMAAAPGCIKIPAIGGRLLHKRGDPILPSQIKMNGYGNTLVLTHGNGFDTQYSHLKSIKQGLYWGQCFKRGERIATMGHTGHATGPHLHFAVVKDGQYVNPKNFLMGDDGDGTLNGDFLGQSCKAPKKYPSLDLEMLADLKAGSSSAPRTSSIGGTGRVR